MRVNAKRGLHEGINVPSVTSSVLPMAATRGLRAVKSKALNEF